MRRDRSVWSVVTTLVGPFAMAILGAVVALALTHREDAGPDEPAVPGRTGRALLSDDGENHHVTLFVADGAVGTNLVVHGAEGEPLARIRLYQDGSITFEPTASDLIPFLVHRNASRFVELGLSNGKSRFALSARPDGSAEMFVTDPIGQPTCDVRITQEGDVRPQFYTLYPFSRVHNQEP
jgi:hypothetical protein